MARLTVSVHIPEQATHRGEPLVAVFQNPSSPPYRIPLEIDQEHHRYSATVDLRRLSTTIGNPPKATPIQVLIARQQGLHLEELVRRTVVITIAIPGYADHGRGAGILDLSPHLTDLSHQPQRHTAELALSDARMEEEDLFGDRRLLRQEGYWKMLQGLIRRRMQGEAGSHRNTDVQRMPIVGFRLYANGEAQLIEIERSSGNVELDQAAVLAVVNAHPFPPFPSGTRDSHVDVHVDLPAFIR